jgi:hypothetical protein
MERLESRTLMAAGPTAPAPLASPSDVFVATTGLDRLDVTWTDNSTDETQFILERATGLGRFKPLASLPAGTTSYSDNALNPLTKYRYRVRAAAEAVVSKWSRGGSGVTASWLTAIAASTTEVDLTWADLVTGETQFVIERAKAKGTFKRIAVVAADLTAYTDTTVSAGAAYRYRIKAPHGTPLLHLGTAAATTPTAPASLPVTFSENFSSGAGDFNVVDGTWAAAGGVFEVTANNAAATTHLSNRALHGTAVTGDFVLTVDALAEAAEAPWANFAVIFGYQDALNYYFFSSNQSNDVATSGIFRVVDGVSTEMADVAAAITPGVTYQLRLERSGSEIRAYRDGTLVASANDATFMSGLVGLGSRQFQASFDNFAVSGTAAAPPASAPAAPSGLTAVAGSSSRVDLSWADNSGDEAGFKVERSVAGGAWEQVAAVAADARSYAATGLTASTAYQFRVRAYNAAGDSAYSNTASATTPAAPAAGARPEASNTGLAVAGLGEAELQVVSGQYVARAGEVLEGKNFRGGVVVPAGADNVVIRNCLVSGGQYGIQSSAGARNLLVENTEIRGSSSKGLLVHYATLRRLYIHDVGSDGMFIHDGGNVLVEYCYITRCGKDNPTDHTDGIQVHTPGSNIVIRYNHINLPASAYDGGWAGTWGLLNSCIVFQSDWGAISDSRIEGNWLYGGGYTVRLEEKGGYQITGITVAGNRFGRDYEYAPLGRIETPGFTWADNVWDDNGQIILVSSSVRRAISTSTVRRVIK